MRTSQELIQHGPNGTGNIVWVSRPVSTLEELSAERIEEHARICPDDKNTRKGFKLGQIVRWNNPEPSPAYYAAPREWARINMGDLCVIGSFGGPKDFCVDYFKNGRVVRASAYVSDLKK